METTYYKHTQRGYLLPGSLIAAALILAGISAKLGWTAANVVVVAVLVVTAFLFYSLTVEIRGDALLVRFGPGFIRKRIPLSEIRNVKIVKNPWYYGWGIHVTPHGWLYNVSGLEAVEVEHGSGRTFRVGTDEPVKLTEAIRSWTKA